MILADREMVETQSDVILHNAATEDVSLLVVGDPFGSDIPFSFLCNTPPPTQSPFFYQGDYAYRYHTSGPGFEDPYLCHP